MLETNEKLKILFIVNLLKISLKKVRYEIFIQKLQIKKFKMQGNKKSYNILCKNLKKLI